VQLAVTGSATPIALDTTGLTLTDVHTLTPTQRFNVRTPNGSMYLDVQGHQRQVSGPTSGDADFGSVYDVVIDALTSSGDIDVHIVTHAQTGRGLALPHGRGSLTARRKLQGYLLAVTLPPLLTFSLTPFRGEINLVSDMLLFLLLTVVVSLVGGLVPALIAAVAGSALLNYFFTPPLHTFTIGEANNTLALLVFILVATLVSSTVDLAARRTRQAARAASAAAPAPNPIAKLPASSVVRPTTAAIRRSSRRSSWAASSPCWIAT